MKQVSPHRTVREQRTAPEAHRRQSQQGFTIVELLIVIVVIGILAAITIVAYNGIQNRAKDTQIRQAVTQVEKAIRQYAIINETTTFKGGSGSMAAAGPNGCTDSNGTGFFGSGVYPCSVEDTLLAAKLLPVDFAKKLPKNPYYNSAWVGGGLSIMLYGCGTGKAILLWTLLSPSSEDAASITATQTACGTGVMQRDSWGMRAAKVIQL